MNLIRITQKEDVYWHIPVNQGDIMGEEVYAVRVLCGETILFDRVIPEGWTISEKDVTVKEVCRKCLSHHVVKMD